MNHPFLHDVKDFAKKKNVKVSTLIQYAGCGNGYTWDVWRKGRGPTLFTVTVMQDYMAEFADKKLEAWPKKRLSDYE